jgi:hypothetical protein
MLGGMGCLRACKRAFLIAYRRLCFTACRRVFLTAWMRFNLIACVRECSIAGEFAGELKVYLIEWGENMIDMRVCWRA